MPRRHEAAIKPSKSLTRGLFAPGQRRRHYNRTGGHTCCFRPVAAVLSCVFGPPEGQRHCMKIRILITGGTFDKEYDELTGRLFFRDTHLPEMLRLGRCRLDVAIETVMMIDSLELEDSGRMAIVERARESAETAIVITHGTDTIVETARALAAGALRDKTIVLTGAMVPYAFGSSD